MTFFSFFIIIINIFLFLFLFNIPLVPLFHPCAFLLCIFPFCPPHSSGPLMH